MSKIKSFGAPKLILPTFLLSAGLLSTVLFPARPSGAVSSSSAGTELGATVVEYIRLALDTDNIALTDGTDTVITPSASGTLATGNLNLAVTTNTTKGFSISIYTQDDTTAMTNLNPSVSTSIASVAGASGYDAASGIASLATDTWGFRKKTGTDTYGNWFGVGADAAHATVIENTNSSSSEYCSTLEYPLENSGCATNTYAEHSLNFGANLTSALPAGTYANNVIISAVAKSEGQTYSVSFDSNGGQNTMGSRTIVAGSTFTLPGTTNVTKPGYTLSGFAFTAGATTPAYTPNQTVTVADFLAAATAAGQTPDSGITLYLIWKESLVAMQDFDCSSLSANEITTLADNRDNHEYKVKKLPDGKCWMIQNLTLSATDLVTEGKALTSANTNIPASDTSSYYIPPRNTRYDTADSITNSAVATASATVDFSSGNSNQPQVAYKAKGDTNHNTGNALPEDTAWYPFYTATLGFSYYGDDKSSGSSPRDICPKGWRLPWTSDSGSTSTGTGDLYTLALSYNNSSSVWTDYITPGSSSSNNPYTSNATVRQNMIYGDSGSLDPTLEDNGAAGFTYAGSYGGTALYSVGRGLHYWSSSVNDSYYGYSLYFGYDPFSGTSDMYPQSGGSKNNGFAVRCVTGS